MSQKEEKPWEKREESLKTRIWFFITGSIATLILVAVIFVNNYQSTEFVVTMGITGGLVILSAIIIIIAIAVQKKHKKRTTD